MSNLSNYERETIINYNYADDMASVYTFDKKLQNKLNRLAETRTDVEVVERCGEWATYKVPKNFIKVSPPRQVNYTDEQKAAMAERLAAARNKKGYE